MCKLPERRRQRNKQRRRHHEPVLVHWEVVVDAVEEEVEGTGDTIVWKVPV
jgi:hypothetical protein